MLLGDLYQPAPFGGFPIYAKSDEQSFLFKSYEAFNKTIELATLVCQHSDDQAPFP